MGSTITCGSVTLEELDGLEGSDASIWVSDGPGGVQLSYSKDRGRIHATVTASDDLVIERAMVSSHKEAGEVFARHS